MKKLLAFIRWGPLSPDQTKKLEELSLAEAFSAPYLSRKY